ncbi:MAG: YbaB/EbfC family nucleoid-associated protein [Bacteroidetes bacterium]|nr:YbaB/EbfC family nucleoid-associated protein [Bacteroidota bacterium]MCL5739243.1 YbaB/EbfC family nucleoid-associated protein [Bacteroidota bacterium]
MNDFGNMQKMFAEFQKNLEKAMSELENMSVTGEAGGGMVKVTANGKREIMKVEIEPELIKSQDKEMVEDLVAAAVNNALEKAEKLATDHLGSSAGGLLTMLPGFKFGGIS